jgi:hypothetical protein
MQRAANCGPLLGGPGIHSTLFLFPSFRQRLRKRPSQRCTPCSITTTLTPPPADLPDPHSYLQFKNQNGIHPRTRSQRRSLYLYPYVPRFFTHIETYLRFAARSYFSQRFK